MIRKFDFLYVHQLSAKIFHFSYLLVYSFCTGVNEANTLPSVTALSSQTACWQIRFLNIFEIAIC